MADFLTEQTIGAFFSGADYNGNLDHIEAFFKDLGPWVISGLVPSAGVGLQVSVTAGVALFNGRLEATGAFTIGGLTDATTNHLYVLNTGAGTSNTTGTAPANSVKIGTAVTAAGAVSSVQTNWTSGRQLLVRHENFVHGSGAGHPRAVDLASWHASNNEGNEVKGTLPAGAQAAQDHGTLTGLGDDDHSQYVFKSPAADARNEITSQGAAVIPLTVKGHASQSDNLQEWQNSGGTALAWIAATGSGKVAGLSIAQTAKSADYTLTDSDFACWVDATGGNVTITLPTAVGRAGRMYTIKKVAGANNVIVDGDGSENIDGATTAVITTLYASITVVSDNSQWFII